MPRRSHKPTIDEVKGLVTRVEGVYAELHREFEDDDRYYNLDFVGDLKIPEEMKEHATVLPTVRDVVDTAVDHVATSAVKIEVPLRGVGKAAEDQAQMLRKFLVGFLYRTREESDTDPVTEAGFQLYTYGMSCIKTVYDPDRWPTEPTRREGETDKEWRERLDAWEMERQWSLPITWSIVHPSNILPDPSRFKRQFVIEKHKKLVLDVSRRWPNWPGSYTKRANDEVDYIEYWDDEYRAVLVDGEPVIYEGRGKNANAVFRHDYGFIPYVIGYSAFGYHDRENKPERLAVGIIRFLRQLFAAESRSFTVADFLVKYGSNPALYVELDEGQDKPTIKLGLADINYVRPGQVPKVLQLGVDPSMMRDHHEVINQIIMNSRAPRAVQGMREPGVGSGYQQALITGRAELRYGKTKDALARMLSDAFSKTLAIAERVVPGPMTVWARTPVDSVDVKLEKEAIKGHYVNHVELEPISPEENARNIQTMSALVSNGFISRDTGRRKYLPNIDPDAEERKIAVERLRDDPAIRKVLVEYLVARLRGAQAVSDNMSDLQDALSIGGRSNGSAPPAAFPTASPTPGSPEDIARTLRQEASPPPEPRGL